MKAVYCPKCNQALTLWEGYKVLNFRQLECSNCECVLEPKWSDHKVPLWKRRLSVLLWSFPAMLAMTVVWFEPSWWLYLIIALTLFHILALGGICGLGCYSVQVKN